jgi:hypothetical protein
MVNIQPDQASMDAVNAYFSKFMIEKQKEIKKKKKRDMFLAFMALSVMFIFYVLSNL